MQMIDYMQDKVNNYCNNKKKECVEFSLYHVKKMLERETCLWNLSAVLYGTWLRETSELETKELSEQEW